MPPPLTQTYRRLVQIGDPEDEDYIVVRITLPYRTPANAWASEFSLFIHDIAGHYGATAQYVDPDDVGEPTPAGYHDIFAGEDAWEPVEPD